MPLPLPSFLTLKNVLLGLSGIGILLLYTYNRSKKSTKSSSSENPPTSTTTNDEDEEESYIHFQNNANGVSIEVPLNYVHHFEDEHPTLVLLFSHQEKRQMVAIQKSAVDNRTLRSKAEEMLARAKSKGGMIQSEITEGEISGKLAIYVKSIASFNVRTEEYHIQTVNICFEHLDSHFVIQFSNDHKLTPSEEFDEFVQNCIKTIQLFTPTPFSTDNILTYKNYQAGYEIQLPPDFHAVGYDENETLFIQQSTEKEHGHSHGENETCEHDHEEFSPYIKIIHKKDTELTLKEIMERLAKNFSITQTEQLISLEDTKLANQDAKFLSYKQTFESGVFLSLNVLMMKERDFYKVELKIEKSDYDKHESKWRNVMNNLVTSFKMEEEGTE